MSIFLKLVLIHGQYTYITWTEPYNLEERETFFTAVAYWFLSNMGNFGYKVILWHWFQ